MSDDFLYRQIADMIRREIMSGERKPGSRLPPVRAMTKRWGCTLGTVQRAYHELAQQGLVTSRAGQGTRVVERLPIQGDTPLRRAGLVHRAETFLLEVLTAGYSPSEAEDAVRQALDRWRTVAQTPLTQAAQKLHFAGSHDLVMAWLASHFGEIVPGYELDLSFSGSLGGLMALAQGRAELAGSHLWDEESDTYNLPFIRRLLPGRRMAVVTLAHRSLGLIIRPGNPHSITGLADLARPGLRFVNRQAGSGTRVWLDAQLQRAKIVPRSVAGYGDEMLTHSEVARAIAEGQADVGLGLESAAHLYGLDHIPMTRERYDLIIPEENMALPAVESLLAWLSSAKGRQVIMSLEGYQAGETGSFQWVG